MNRNNRIFILILSLILLLITPIQGIAEDNAGTGNGSTRGKVEGKGFYRG